MTEKMTDEQLNVALQKLYRDEHEDRVRDLGALLRMPEGKRYFWWLLESVHMFSTTFTGNSTGAFKEGERNVGLRIFNDILKLDPKLMGQMAQAHAAKIKTLQGRKTEALKESKSQTRRN